MRLPVPSSNGQLVPPEPVPVPEPQGGSSGEVAIEVELAGDEGCSSGLEDGSDVWPGPLVVVYCATGARPTLALASTLQ